MSKQKWSMEANYIHKWGQREKAERIHTFKKGKLLKNYIKN
jgi:hypothetical protein